MDFRVKNFKNWVILGLAACSLVLLFMVVNGRETGPVPDQEHGEATAEAVTWTCSMHPQIRQSKPGSCPICGMDLIPLTQGDDDDGPWELTLSERARKLADIQTAVVERRQIAHEIRMVGKVDYDEKRVRDISAWVPGRIERLFVDFTGIQVRKGDHMVELYSPDLVNAQQELRQAKRSATSGPASIRKAGGKRLNAARKKLKLLGLSPKQVQAIENGDTSGVHLTIEAPMAGIVIKKHLNEGSYVKTGSPIYTVADLSRVWIILEAYESELTWLRYGQEASLAVEAYPGEEFTGRIVFIDPTLNPKTRTVKVRIDLPNPDGKLKPNMFVHAVVHALISSGGKVIDPSLAGKWISPMHPEVVKDGPGSCDVCGMALVRAESLGFITADESALPLIIPASAALVTGQRAVVYIATDKEGGSFEGREIVLGPEAGNFYVVMSGLEEGERVVVNGAFKIDSELQIRAKKSMMYHTSPSETALVPQVTQASFRKELQPLYQAYFAMQTQLSQDALHPVHQAGSELETALGAVTLDTLTPKARAVWEREAKTLLEHLADLAKAPDLDRARSVFELVSQSIYDITLQLGPPDGATVYRFHCPMAFDNKGADWLQNHTQTSNPYFGAAMFSCGSQVEDVTASRAKAAATKPPKGGGHVH